MQESLAVALDHGVLLAQPGTRASLQTSNARISSEGVMGDHELSYPRAGSQLAFARAATALAVVSVGAFAIGALAVRWLAIKQLAIEGAAIKRLRIGELEVDRLQVNETITQHQPSSPS
ncbi:MAG TPA: hypothetical protein VM406_01715 [Noviherbaspirillum sp.]|nr:hypothetical protein [Noviherbaspirillum sp.]